MLTTGVTESAPGRQDRYPFLFKCIGRSHLPPRRFFNRQLTTAFPISSPIRFLSSVCCAIFSGCGFVACLVQFLESMKNISAIRHHPTCLGDVAQLLAQLQYPQLWSCHLSSCTLASFLQLSAALGTTRTLLCCQMGLSTHNLAYTESAARRLERFRLATQVEQGTSVENANALSY
jgi:hypothetical protein